MIMGKNEMRKYVLIFFCITIATIVAFISLGDRTLSNHEAFVSVTAREMIENDEYIIPTFNNQCRFNKTPLPYWLVVVASHFTGRIDEFTARLPSATIAVLSVICILYFITVILNFKTAFLASLIWTCSLGFIRYSHCARPEMHLTFFMLICFLSFYAAIEEANRTKRVAYSLIFWVSLGLSVLAKAISSIFFVAFSAIIYLTFFKQWKKIPKILPVWGSILFLLIILPWPIAAANAMNWNLSLWQQESIDRFTGGNGRSGHEWLYYFPMIFLFVTPWVVFLPLAIVAPFRKVWKNKRKIMGYLWICFFTGIVFLSLCSGKRQHYILPLMPLATILIGIVIEDMVLSRTAYFEKESLNLLKWHLFTFFLIGLIILAYSFEPLYNYSCKLIANKGFSLPAYSSLPVTCQIATGLILVLGTSSSIFLYSIKRRMAACLVIFSSIAFVIVFLFSMISVLPDNGDYSEAKFASELKRIIPLEDDVFVYGKIDELFIHYFGRPIKTASEASIKHIYNNNNWLIFSGEKLDKIKEEYNFKEVRTFQKNSNKPERIVIVHKNN